MLIKIIETVILTREASLQDLAAKRNAAAATRAGINLQNQKDSDLDCSWLTMELKDGIKEMDHVEKVKQEPDDSDDIRLSDIPEFNNGDDDDGWLKDLDSEDEANVPHPPSIGREHKAARKVARVRIAELRARNAVDRWVRFVRLELGRPEDDTSSTKHGIWDTKPSKRC